ncbi:DUF4259 domain-containing protein [Streptomyces candidus]|uniref:DUF4259 domain-containing protein n=1 Tax=Streptomyces candidus TaxID=67283 RepID=A0A7X0HPB9_9ACTN|nr:DUF4259 domain-containing protein [Streptomyces candidus]MBB6440149.1 hypothetical protein [Streptomyces candidus]GHH57611.1 hypothetical protein GCM10018773_65170 [Streptomyces candidus]
MGTWGTGPFDSDRAADFVDELEGLPPEKVIEVLERAFRRVMDCGGCVEGGDGTEAVAAAALVASTIPGNGMMLDPEDGPREPLPQLPLALRTTAVLALQCVLQGGSELLTGWVDSADAARWRHEVQRIAEALGPIGHEQ